MSDNAPQRLDTETITRTIQHMDRDELRLLNRLVVQRLKLLDQAHATAQLAQLNLGDRVGFNDNDGQRTTGTVIRLNKKTAAVLTDDEQRWNVSPNLLERT